ncbi:MAG: hypothetical protein Q9167_004706 [Letrouitia subvulpina]
MSTGGNILSRMLQMEKQSKHFRNASANGSSNISQTLNVPNGSINPQSAPSPPMRPPPLAKNLPPHPLQSAPSAPSRPNERSPSPLKPNTTKASEEKPSLPRSQTVPALSIDVEASKGDKLEESPKDQDGAADSESVTYSEICLSPSWSDFGGAKRKKEKKRQEKERKELEKKMKKEEGKQRAAELRAGKRLSKKPPPAAMETQKMPSALRRNSIISFISSHSSSAENSRRPSREERRLSVDSSKENRRSQSTPASSTELPQESPKGWQPVVSPIAPQLPRLPRLGWHSRSGSSGTDKSRSWGSDDAYEKEIVNFAYQFQASTSPAFPRQIKLDQVKTGQVSRPHIITRSQTDTNLMKVDPQTVEMDISQPPPVQDRKISKSTTRGNHYDLTDKNPGLSDTHHLNSSKSTKSQSIAIGRPKSNRTGPIPPPKAEDRPRIAPNSLAPPVQTRPTTDGSSYVHKQRMYQQQMSIARFEDEQAVKDANEANREDEGLPPEDHIPQHLKVDLSEQLSRQTKQKANSEAKPSYSEGKAKEQRLPPQQNLNYEPPKDHSDTVLHRSEATPGSKFDRIIGFRRQKKPEPQKIVLPGKTVVADKRTSKRSPPPPLPNIEIEPLPASPESKRSVSSGNTKSSELAQEQKSGYVQNHSRTRTSSSQLLGEDMPFSKPLPRSSTAPVLLPEMKVPSSPERKSNVETKTKAERKSVTFDSNVGEARRDGKPSTENAAPGPEIVVGSISPEGIVRKTSIKRPRSNPNIQLTDTTKELPNLDFLPQLKHQPLTKPNRSSNRLTITTPADSDLSTKVSNPSSLVAKPTPDPSNPLPLSSSAPNLAVAPRSPLRAENLAQQQQGPESTVFIPPHSARHRNVSPRGPRAISRVSAFGSPNVFGKTPKPSEAVTTKPIAKLFVICCKCNYWHDLPSKLYAAMAVPKNLTRDPSGEGAPGSIEGPSPPGTKEMAVGKGGQASGKKQVAEATLETMVKWEGLKNSFDGKMEFQRGPGWAKGARGKSKMSSRFIGALAIE